MYFVIISQVCGKTIRQELTKALDQCLPRLASIDSAPPPAANRQPFSAVETKTNENVGDSSNDLQKIIVLRKALRAAAVNGEQRDADTKVLRCELTLQCMCAIPAVHNHTYTLDKYLFVVLLGICAMFCFKS
jgi:hypothetical protein